MTTTQTEREYRQWKLECESHGCDLCGATGVELVETPTISDDGAMWCHECRGDNDEEN